MKKVAKLLIIDPDSKHLLLYRSNHPTFGNDPDLPGGTLEDDETLAETMVREVNEEVGVEIDMDFVSKRYSGTDYSVYGTLYVLFVAHVERRPEIAISWEHSSYEWLNRKIFIEKAKNANDTYMHMVSDVLQQNIK